MKSCAIYDDLVTNPHNEAPGYSTVTLWVVSCELWLRLKRLIRFSESGNNLPEDPQVYEAVRTILSVLTTEPFASVRNVARLTCPLYWAVHSYLTCSRRFVVRHLCWITNLMTNE
jgi:hypothetical protein